MTMSAFNFAEHAWLWALALIPLVILLYAIYFDPGEAMERLKQFADAHLLPHLVKNREKIHKSPIAPLLLWALIWGCGLLAMAGPRWSYTDVQAHRPERDLVILLDLSKSMDTEDVKPSRLMRAREEIQDILAANKKLDIGIVAFAAVPHMVVPLTSDMATIRHLLPYLDTKLVYMQGSRLKPAIEMAVRMLRAANGSQKSILIISDGGFPDVAGAGDSIPNDIAVYTMGIGTLDGAPIPGRGGYVKDNNNQMVIAKLDEDRMRSIANAGHGIYARADYSSNDTQAILTPLQSGVDSNKDAGRTVRVWDEKFWIPALAMALCMLPLFRRGYIFPVILFFLLTMSANPAHAEWQDMFRNNDQNGAAAYKKGDYGKAEELFSTPYRRGLAQYKKKKYDDAVKSFSEVNNPERRLDATYNLGNSQLMANHAQEAVTAYESYLKERPDDKAAQHNLEVAKKLLQQQQQKPIEQQKQSGEQKDQQGQQSSQNDQQKQQQDQKSEQQKSAEDQKKGDSKQQNQNGVQKDQPKPGEEAQKQDGQSGDKQQNGQQSAQQKPEEKKGQEQKPTQGQDEKAAQEKKDENKNAQGQPQPDKPKDEQKKEGQSQQLPQQGKDQKSPNPDDEGQQNAGDEGNNFRQERRTPADIDADQWLSRVDSDPGPFLRKQFEMESRKSGARPEAEPW